MAYIIGMAKNELELYNRLKMFMTGNGTLGQWSFTGAGNGKLIDVRFTGGAVAQTYTLTCVTTDLYGGTFSVEGSIAGRLPNATVNVVYYQPTIQFYIDTGTTSFSLGDTFTLQGVSGSVHLDSFSGGVIYKDEVFTVLFNSSSPGATFTVKGEEVCTCKEKAAPPEGETTPPECDKCGVQGEGLQGREFQGPALSFSFPEDAEFTKGQEITIPMTANPLAQDGQHWRVLRSQFCEPQDSYFGAPAGGDDRNILFQGTGFANDDNVFFGIERTWDNTKGRALWTMCGFTGCLPSLSYVDQPGATSKDPNYLPSMAMWDLELPYVISVTGRRVLVHTTSNRADVCMYGGLFLQYGTRANYTYPLMIGGSLSKRYLDSTDSAPFSSYWCPYGGNGSSPQDPPCILRTPDGRNLSMSSGIDDTPSMYDTGVPIDNVVWPYYQDGMHQLRENLDGTYPIIRIVLGGTWGEIDGVYAISGYEQKSGNLVIQDNRKFKVFANYNRTGRGDYCAVELK